jgi:hypothetical protein
MNGRIRCRNAPWVEAPAQFANMNANIFEVILMAAGLLLAVESRAALFDITFSGENCAASGQIDVANNSATSGFLDVTYNGTTIDYNYLAVSGAGQVIVSDNNGDNLPYGGTGNYVSATSTPFLDANGLLFLTAPIVNGHTSGGGMYISIDQYSQALPAPYNLTGYGNSPSGFGWGAPNVDGTATITPVPEPTTMLAGALLLVPFAASTVRRRPLASR